MANFENSRFWPRLLVAAKALPRLAASQKPTHPKRIVIAHHLLLGDTIMLAGLFKKLRRDYPDAEIVSLVPSAWMPLFAGEPYGVRALSYNPRSLSAHQKLIASGPYDWGLVPADNRWSWVARAMGARWVTAFAGGSGGSKDWPVDEKMDWPTEPEAWGDIASRLVPGPEPEEFQAGEWPAPPMPTAFPQIDKPYVVFHLGASSPHKLWLVEHWQDLAVRIDRAGYRVVLSAGPKEIGLVAAVDPEGRHVSMAGKLDMGGLWHLLAKAAFMVSPDTGVAHLARLTGTPAVVLFGPGSPVVSGPGRFWRSSPFKPVWVEEMPCRNQNLLFERPLPWVRHCWRSVAECGNPKCMQGISMVAVMTAIEDIAGVKLW